MTIQLCGIMDIIEVKTPHEWRNVPYGVDECRHCNACSYAAFGTEYCEDYREIVATNEAIKTGTHPALNMAFEKMRTILNAEEWKLVSQYTSDHYRLPEYRMRDTINVKDLT